MKKIDFKKLARRSIRSLVPYQAKEIPCMAKLDANESPHLLSGKPLVERLSRVPLNRYPDPEAKELKKVLAVQLKVGAGNLLLGNGSDELIYNLVIAFGGPVLYPVPTFSMYGIISTALGEECVGIPLDRDFDLDTDRMLSAVREKRPKLVFLSSPNNPTGNCFSSEAILKIIEQSKGIVVVDEAYQPFSGGEGFLPLLKDYKNLAILRTLSKIGLASLRVGFLVGDEELIREVNKPRLPFNVNALSQAAAIETLREKKGIRSGILAVVSERERLLAELDRMAGVTPYPSEANFILFKVGDAPAVFKRLMRTGVLVRDLNSVIKGALRVTVGTRDENDLFLNALRKITGGRKR